eukprot:9414731-Pyramimonas_sp.AAC.1
MRAEAAPIAVARSSLLERLSSRNEASSLRMPAESRQPMESKIPRKNRIPCVSILESANGTFSEALPASPKWMASVRSHSDPSPHSMPR